MKSEMKKILVMLLVGIIGISPCWAGTIVRDKQGSAQMNGVVTTPIHVTANAQSEGTPFVHYWSKVVGSGHAALGLRATWQDELATVAKYCGFKYVRFHGIFSDGMMDYRESKQGKPIYNWQYVDDLYDGMLAKGVRPFVELDFSPSALATVKDTTFWWKANGSPPSSYAKWSALVQAFVAHCVQRYGKKEVESWYFEVWNEPNLSKPFFRGGDQAKYFELYNVTAKAIKSVDPRLRVGGPATSSYRMDKAALATMEKSGKPINPWSIPWKPVWVKAFLVYCHQNHLPVDFVSTHPYPQPFSIGVPNKADKKHYLRSIYATHNDLATVRNIVEHSAFPHAEIICTEWSSSPDPLDYTHDSLPEAAFIAKTNLESAGLVEGLSYWTFSDVFEENRDIDTPFHGGFGLINYQQIVKPAFHAYQFMNELGDTRIGWTRGAVITKQATSGKIVAMAYNYPLRLSLPVSNTLQEANELADEGDARMLNMTITHLPPHAAFQIEVLNKNHGDALRGWEEMGTPNPPSIEQTKELRRLAWATMTNIVQADGAGTLKIHKRIRPWAVILIKEL